MSKNNSFTIFFKESIQICKKYKINELIFHQFLNKLPKSLRKLPIDMAKFTTEQSKRTN